MREKVLLSGILLLIYATVATWGHFDFSSMMGFYGALADAFEKGQLYLDVRPEQGLIHDLIPYQGRYYLQWGPFPVILHLIGKWTGLGLTDRVVCVLAGWLTGVVFFSIIANLRREYFPQVPKGVCRWFLFAFALATPVTLVSFRGTIYHESIVVAVLGIMIGCVALLRYLQTVSARWLLLCGAMIAAAVATRVSPRAVWSCVWLWPHRIPIDSEAFDFKGALPCRGVRRPYSGVRGAADGVQPGQVRVSLGLREQLHTQGNSAIVAIRHHKGAGEPAALLARARRVGCRLPVAFARRLDTAGEDHSSRGYVFIDTRLAFLTPCRV